MTGTQTPLVLAARTIEVSDFVTRISIAAAAGYVGIGLRPEDYQAARAAGLSDADMRALLAAHQLDLVEVQSVQGWAGDACEREAALAQAEQCLQVADALGGASYLSVNLTRQVGDLDAAAEGFAAVAALADRHGVLAALEYLAWGPVRDGRTARDIIGRSGAGNGRVLVDSWHLFQVAGGLDDLRAMPIDMVGGVQFSDGRAGVRVSMAEDSKHQRHLPGAGDFPLVEFIAVLDELGYRGTYSIEVLSDECRALAPAVAARDAFVCTRKVLHEARAADADADRS